MQGRHHIIKFCAYSTSHTINPVFVSFNSSTDPMVKTNPRFHTKMLVLVAHDARDHELSHVLSHYGFNIS